MFAFAIYDREEKSIFIARDWFGIKPLYYYVDEEKIFFASEIKAILPLLDKKLELDRQWVIDYFALKFIPAPNTIYQSIKKLPAGSRLKAQFKNGKIEIDVQKYWQNRFINLQNSPPTSLISKNYSWLPSASIVVDRRSGWRILVRRFGFQLDRLGDPRTGRPTRKLSPSTF